MQVLRYGSVGPQVELVQLGLQRFGLLTENPDGIYGARTQSAVRSFQRKQGLNADGIVGAVTWSALNPWLVGYVKITVHPGDTFYRLAERYGISLKSVEAANPGVDALNLRVGQQLTIPLPFPLISGDVHFSSPTMEYCIRGLKGRYPFLFIESIGKSVLGTSIPILRFGSGEHSVFYNASHHANEWITSPVLLRYLERLCEAYVHRTVLNGVSAAELYRSCTLHICPMVNPDGVDLVTGEIAQGSSGYFTALSLNGGPDNFPQNWKANIRGVDLNLQYPAGWEEAKRIKFSQGYTRPGPRDYVGTAPLTQPESKAVYDYTLKNSFALTLSYHTQGEVIYWKYDGYLPAQSEAIGKQLANLSGYALELTPENSAYAGYKDWFIQEYNLPGYTIEAGKGENPLPLNQFSRIYAKNEPLLTYALIAGNH